ncbi:hypothetical protein [Brunnivagina elsteri]|uniref:hypothetical protein n=1 Tax=Brunnivagina elsteri TaxID=1247191 RepID=UPI00130419F3|nr:hypothetical protein [Calothrix elsteri]
MTFYLWNQVRSQAFRKIFGTLKGTIDDLILELGMWQRKSSLRNEDLLIYNLL